MDTKEQNWKNFCDNHLRDWHGIWTRYSPAKEITESFQSLRSFHSNPEQTQITQTNHYRYADGTTKEETWEFNQDSNSLADGLFHPARRSLRGIFFEQGAAVWVTTQLKTDAYFSMEIFFKHEDLRHSIGIVYDDAGSLMRTASVREDATGFPSQYWTPELKQLPERNLSGNWQGTSVTLTHDLKISTPVPIQLQWPWQENETFFFPDGISLSCPGQIRLGKGFLLAANWLVNASHLQQIMVKFDEKGAFANVTLQLFHLTAEI